MAVYCGYHRVHNQVNKQVSQINKTKLSWHHNFECQTWFYFDELWKGWWAKIVRKDDFIAHWFSKNSEEWQTKTIFLFVCNIQKHRSCVSEKEDKNIFPYIVSSVLLYCTNIQFTTTSKYLFGTSVSLRKKKVDKILGSQLALMPLIGGARWCNLLSGFQGN